MDRHDHLGLLRREHDGYARRIRGGSLGNRRRASVLRTQHRSQASDPGRGLPRLSANGVPWSRPSRGLRRVGCCCRPRATTPGSSSHHPDRSKSRPSTSSSSSTSEWTSMNVGLDVRVLDQMGLAYPLAAHTERLEDGRIGHDKNLYPDWVVAGHGNDRRSTVAAVLPRRRLGCGRKAGHHLPGNSGATHVVPLRADLGQIQNRTSSRHSTSRSTDSTGFRPTNWNAAVSFHRSHPGDVISITDC